MATVSKFTRHYTASLVTGFTIILLVLFYIFYYIPEREEKVNARYYRVLQRISENLNTKVEHYQHHVAPNYLRDIHASYTDPRLTPDSTQNTASKQDKFLASTEASQEKDYTTPDFDEWVINKISDENSAESSAGLKIAPNCQDCPLYVNATDKSMLIPVSDTVNSNIKHMALPLDSLLLPLMRWDTFNNFLVLQRGDTSTEKPDRLIFLARRDSRYSHVNLVPADTLVKMAKDLSWKSPASLNIAGAPHRLFVLTLQVAPGEEWALYGAVPARQYDTERKAIPSHVLTFALLTLAILFLAFPFLKLILMSRQERLHKHDIIVSVISLFSAVALITIFLLDGYTYYGADRNVERKRLENLHEALSSNMVQELGAIVQQLKRYDALSLNTSLKKLRWQPVTTKPADTIPSQSDGFIRTGHAQPYSPPLYFLTGEKEFEGQTLEKNSNNTDTVFEQIDTLRSPDIFSNFIRVFWMDSDGGMNRIWTSKPTIGKAERVGKREYFKAIRNGVGWYLPEVADTFYLQSISSLTYGGKFAVISTPSDRQITYNKKKEYVIALTTKLASIYHAILPPGYGFCVIDNKGDVLFHQSENLNLSENLLEETLHDPALATALLARMPVHLNPEYQGATQLMYVAPLDRLPLFLVTYVNHDSRRNSNAYAIMQTLLFFLLYCLSLSMLIALVVCGRKRFSKLSFSWLPFRWLWPDPGNALCYLKNLIAFCVSIFIVAEFAGTGDPVALFFILLYAATYAFIFSYVNLHAVSFRLFFANKTSEHASRLRLFAGSAAIIVLGLNLLCLVADTTAFQYGARFQFALLLGYVATHYLFKSLRLGRKDKNYPPASKKTTRAIIFRRWLTKEYQSCYVLMILFWLLLTSALPAYYMFRASYNLEAARKVMLTQLHLASRLNATIHDRQPAATGTTYPNALAPQIKSYSYTAFYQQTTHKKAPSTFAAHQDHIKPDIPLRHYDHITAAALGSDLAHIYQKPAENTPRFIASAVNLSSWFLKSANSNIAPSCRGTSCIKGMWSTLDKPTLEFYPTRVAGADSIMAFSSTLPKFSLPSLAYHGNTSWNEINKSALLFWMGVCLLTLSLCFFMSFLVNRVFNLQILRNIRMSKLDRTLLHPKHRNRLIVISLPGAPDIRTNILNPGNNVRHQAKIVEHDMARANQAFNPASCAFSPMRKKYLLYVRNFDHLPFQQQSLKLKVETLLALNRIRNAKIILESALHPSCWEEKLAAMKKQSGPTAILMRQLLSLLGDYTKVYNPLQENVKPYPLAGAHRMGKKELLLHFVKRECHSLPILMQFEKKLCTYVQANYKQKRSIEKEDLIYRIKSLAQLYYRRLWATCTEEEKYFLYDLAQDGLVNARNMGVLTSLLGKGLLVRYNDMRLRIVNDSFKSFVLTVVNPMEALQYEIKMAKASRWTTYRTPFLLIIVGVGLFIFFTQHQTWLNILAVGTAVSGILAVLSRLSIFLPAFLLPGK